MPDPCSPAAFGIFLAISPKFLSFYVQGAPITSWCFGYTRIGHSSAATALTMPAVVASLRQKGMGAQR